MTKKHEELVGETDQREEVAEVELKAGMRVRVSANAIPYEDGENYHGREGVTVREERGAWWVLLDGEAVEQWFAPSELEVLRPKIIIDGSQILVEY